MKLVQLHWGEKTFMDWGFLIESLSFCAIPERLVSFVETSWSTLKIPINRKVKRLKNITYINCFVQLRTGKESLYSYNVIIFFFVWVFLRLKSPTCTKYFHKLLKNMIHFVHVIPAANAKSKALLMLRWQPKWILLC